MTDKPETERAAVSICPSCGKTAKPYCDLPECGLAGHEKRSEEARVEPGNTSTERKPSAETSGKPGTEARQNCTNDEKDEGMPFNAEQWLDCATRQLRSLERLFREANWQSDSTLIQGLSIAQSQINEATQCIRSANGLTQEMTAFLLGEGPFNGVWFGDPHPRYPGKFWWRAFLRRTFPVESGSEK